MRGPTVGISLKGKLNALTHEEMRSRIAAKNAELMTDDMIIAAFESLAPRSS